MTSVQYEVAVTIPAPARVPEPDIDTEHKTGVYCEARKVHISLALSRVERIMREIRMTGKCGEFTGKWNGSAWEFRKCEPPEIVRE